MSFIEITDLTKVAFSSAYNRIVLNKVSLGIQTGESVGILGPSGSGKTTLARLLAGLSHPTTGDIRIDGFVPSDARSRMVLGYMPDRPAFPDHLTALGALLFAARLADLPSEETQARAEGLLESMDLGKWADTKVRKYSPDMLKRLALAVALVAQPECLLVDEPFGKTDPATREIIGRSLRAVRQRGGTLIVLSRSLTSVSPLVSRILIMNHGRIVKEAPVAELILEAKQVEIEADIGEKLIELEPQTGRVVSVSRKRLVVELARDEAIDHVIDYLRIQGISIHAMRRNQPAPDATWLDMIRREEEMVS
jgi:ABC-type multidrug transport system ATPase subunit